MRIETEMKTGSHFVFIIWHVKESDDYMERKDEFWSFNRLYGLKKDLMNKFISENMKLLGFTKWCYVKVSTEKEKLDILANILRVPARTLEVRTLMSKYIYDLLSLEQLNEELIPAILAYGLRSP
jgi:hemolysin-activating ACP:hemolysin acyltransferase